jgi:hypothetical protein
MKILMALISVMKISMKIWQSSNENNNIVIMSKAAVCIGVMANGVSMQCIKCLVVANVNV